MKLQTCLAWSAIGSGEELSALSSSSKYSALAFRNRPRASASIPRMFSADGLISAMTLLLVIIPRATEPGAEIAGIEGRHFQVHRMPDARHDHQAAIRHRLGHDAQFRDAVSRALERRHAEVQKLWAEALESVGIT